MRKTTTHSGVNHVTRFCIMLLTFSLSLLVSTAFAASTEHQKLRRAPDSSKPNGYIVKLKDGVPRQDSIANLTSLSVGPESTCEVGYSHWTSEYRMGILRSEYADRLFSVINGYSARLSGACLQHVLADPNVEYVEVRTLVRRPTLGRSS